MFFELLSWILLPLFRYMRCLRMAHSNQCSFWTSVVWAEMRKAVSYKVDVSIDARGVIQETQCECGAGQGPSAHCKHVVCVLFAVVQYAATGEVLCEVTCTQV